MRISWFYDEERESLHVGRIIGTVLAAIVFLTSLGLAWRYVIAGPKGAVQAREQVQSGDYRIAAYDHFFALCSSIQGFEGQLSALHTQLRATTDPAQRDRILASIAGVEGQRFQSIARYNAEARENYTRGQFRDSDLPFHIDARRRHTSCGSS